MDEYLAWSLLLMHTRSCSIDAGQRIALYSLPTLCHPHGCAAPMFPLSHWALGGTPNSWHLRLPDVNSIFPVSTRGGQLQTSASTGHIWVYRAATPGGMIDGSFPSHAFLGTGNLKPVLPQGERLTEPPRSDRPSPLVIDVLLQEVFSTMVFAAHTHVRPERLATGFALLALGMAAVAAAAIGVGNSDNGRGWYTSTGGARRAWTAAALAVAAVALPAAVAIGADCTDSSKRGAVVAGSILMVLSVLSALAAVATGARLTSPHFMSKCAPSSDGHKLLSTVSRGLQSVGKSDSQTSSAQQVAVATQPERSRLRKLATVAASRLLRQPSAAALAADDDLHYHRFFYGGGGAEIKVATGSLGGGTVCNSAAMTPPPHRLRVRTRLTQRQQVTDALSAANLRFVQMLRDKTLLAQPQAMALRAANVLALGDDSFMHARSTEHDVASVCCCPLCLKDCMACVCA
jgi:hypothetical protein